MMKPDKNFRLSKPAKTMLALLCESDEDRRFFKSLLIQGQLSAESARRQALRAKSKTREFIDSAE